MNAMNWTIALPELVLACAAMATLIAGAFAGRLGSVVAAAGSVGALLLTAVLVLSGGPGPATAFAGTFAVDGFAIFIKLLCLGAGVLAIIMARDSLIADGTERFEFHVLVTLAVLGMLVMASANDLMTLYLGLELQSLALYVVAAFARDNLRSSEAGLKYFVLGALASGLTLYGSSLVYGFTGSTQFAAIAQVLSDGGASLGLLVGLCFVAAGLAFKISAVPFHMWTPDVYEGAPTPVTAFFSIAPKIAAVGLLVRVVAGPFGAMGAEWRQIIVLLSIASMALGAFAAIGQQNIKRLMAYSSIGHVGYALVGLAAGGQSGLRGVLVYLAIYLFMNAGTFACILSMRRGDDEKGGGRAVEGIDDLAGLGRSDPGMALALAIFMFSMAGIPPLAGFFGKLYVFLAAVEQGLWPLAIIGVLSSVVSAFYYLRIVKLMYFDAPTEPFGPRPASLSFVMAGSAAFTALFFVAPAPLVGAAQAAAAALLAG
jgi:NADH-quinone oxidoreductase subunit N